MEWISTNDQLPPARKYVLGRYTVGNWTDRDDPENVNVVVVKLIYIEPTALTSFDNNKECYFWQSFGPSSYFGQHITYWCPIPEFIMDWT